MSYAWTITKDHMPDPNAKPGTNGNAVGVVGPSTAKLTAAEILGHKDAQRFRMLGDDKDVAYEGYFVDLDGKHDGFEPLDDFGTPNYGCTTIQYWEKGWKTL